MRRLTVYRDDSTTQVVYDNVKHYFWTAGNTVLTIAQYTNVDTGEHRYISWPRERICWMKEIMQVNGLWYCKQHGEAELRKAVK